MSDLILGPEGQALRDEAQRKQMQEDVAAATSGLKWEFDNLVLRCYTAVVAPRPSDPKPITVPVHLRSSIGQALVDYSHGCAEIQFGLMAKSGDRADEALRMLNEGKAGGAADKSTTA